jgi:hypothetical protein
MSYGDSGQWRDTYVRIPFEQGWSGSHRDLPGDQWRRTEATPSHNWGGQDIPGREWRKGADAPLASDRWGGHDIPGRKR